MSRSERRLPPVNSPQQALAPRRVTPTDVDRAADSLLRDGQRPTIEKVRLKIGRGSPNTINPLLDVWWSRLASRLDAGPAALHRLPELVLLAAEGLWMQALDEARRRAAAEQGSTRKALARERQDLEVRSHVLSVREVELSSQVKQRDGRIAHLEIEVAALTTLLRKEQASRLAAERRAPLPRPARAPRASAKRPAKATKRQRSPTPRGRARGRKAPLTRRRKSR